MLTYHARIEPDGDAWTVEFPDCPGCLTFGRSVEEAKANAREALEGWLESMLDLDRPVPRPLATDGEPIEVALELTERLRRAWG